MQSTHDRSAYAVPPQPGNGKVKIKEPKAALKSATTKLKEVLQSS